LAKDPFKLFTFHLIAAFESLEDIHPITLRQISFLSKCGRLGLTLKIKKSHKELSDLIKGARISSGGFDEELERELKIEGASKVWICGPPKMNESLVSSLRKHGHREELYLLL
jgi:predicted ferric reductase